MYSDFKCAKRCDYGVKGYAPLGAILHHFSDWTVFRTLHMDKAWLQNVYLNVVEHAPLKEIVAHKPDTVACARIQL